MGYGPKLTNIVAGQALIADYVMQNFQSLANFLRAIPKGNLLTYKYTEPLQGVFDNAAGVGITTTCGFQRTNAGTPIEQIELAASINPTAVPIADTIAITVEKCSPVGAFPVAADAWIPLGTVTFTAGNTVAANNVGTVATPRFCQSAILTGVATINDGDWIRFVSVNGAASAYTRANATALLKYELR